MTLPILVVPLTFKTSEIFFGTNWVSISFHNSVSLSLEENSKEYWGCLMQGAGTDQDANGCWFSVTAL